MDDGHINRYGMAGHGGGVVRCFVEFSLLPDLLSAWRQQPKDVGTVAAVSVWAELLDDKGYNADHVDDAHIPDGMNLTEFMAVDALRFCSSLHLMGSPGRLPPEGERIANIAATPARQRNREQSRVLTQTLARQIQEEYCGEYNREITCQVRNTIRRRVSANLRFASHSIRRCDRNTCTSNPQREVQSAPFKSDRNRSHVRQFKAGQAHRIGPGSRIRGYKFGHVCILGDCDIM